MGVPEFHAKQTLITRCTIYAELVAIELTRSEAEWFKEFFVEKSLLAILIYWDNQATLTKVKSKNHNSKSSRNIELRYEILRKLNTIGIISLNYVRLEKNLVDHLTKGLLR